MKYSQWHDGSVEPVHIGVYEKGSDDVFTYYSFWTGTIWNALAKTKIKAINEHNNWPDYESIYSNDRWRGLATKPRSEK